MVESDARPTRGAIVLAAVALLMLIGTASAYLNPGLVQGLFGPPQVAMTEAYERRPDGPTFDHAGFDKLLKRHVDEAGFVDYAALREDVKALDAYIEAIGKAPFDELGRDEKLALLINAYNAFTLKLIIEYWDDGKLKSIRDIPAAKRWDDERWNVGGNVWSIDQIEHQEIRPKFKEPRIHWALVCAAVGCPPLRREAYTAKDLEKQLEKQAVYVHTHDRWFRYDREAGVVHLTKLYQWYAGDFEQAGGSVLDYVARHVKPLREDLDAGRRPRVRFLDYDWALNRRENRP